MSSSSLLEGSSYIMRITTVFSRPQRDLLYWIWLEPLPDLAQGLTYHLNVCEKFSVVGERLYSLTSIIQAVISFIVLYLKGGIKKQMNGVVCRTAKWGVESFVLKNSAAWKDSNLDEKQTVIWSFLMFFQLFLYEGQYGWKEVLRAME